MVQDTSSKIDSVCLLLISDRRQLSNLAASLKCALAAAPRGRVAFLLREKDLSARALRELALPLQALCRDAGALFFLSERPDLARSLGADGVHLPVQGLGPRSTRSFWPEGIIGASTHDAKGVATARQTGADYLCFGPLFDTPSKRAYGPPVGLEALAQLPRRRPKQARLFGLGGVNTKNAARVFAAGAEGVAMIRGVLASSDPGLAVEKILQACP